MCGIAGIHLKDRHIGNPNIPLDNLVDGLLMNIVKRGHHATGLCAVTKSGETTVWKKDVEAKDFIQMRDWLPEDTKTVLLHTRYATKGKPEENTNNHPVIYKNCVAVHNGHIDNDDDLFKEYKMHRPAEVDSIAIPMMVHRCGWEAADNAFKELRGAMATAIVNRDRPGELLLARSYNSPLVYFMDNRFFMFASLADYIKDAWEKNYGTAPDKKKLHDLETYSTIRIKDDELVVGKFQVAQRTGVVVPANVQRGRPSEHRNSETIRRNINTAHDRQMFWWDYDAEGAYDPNGATRRIAEQGQSCRAVPPVVETLRCIECGNTHTKMNIKYMKDANVVNRKVLVWDIPVCVKCVTDMHLSDYCDRFTYAHQGTMTFEFKEYEDSEFTEEEMKLFQLGEPWEPADKDDDCCDQCNYFPVSAVGRAGKFLCRSCNLDEKTQEGKRQLERRAKRAEKIQTVKPGDPIPEDLWQHMGPCNNCKKAASKATFISKEGIPVCADCFKIDKLPERNENDPLYGWCQGCDTRFSKKYLQHTWWGVLCDLCLRGEDQQLGLPTEAPTKLEREEGIRQAIHARACKEAAHDCGYSQQFIHWIMVDCTLEHLRDLDMIDTYEDVKDCYDDARWVVEYLLNEGKQELLDNCPMPAEVWTEALSHKED